MGMLEEQGFEIVPDVIDSGAVSLLIQILSSSSLQRSRAGMRNAFQIAEVRSLALDPLLMSFANEALGDKATPFRATLFDKSPYSNWLVVWHQDTALPLCQRRDTPGWGPWSIKQGVICAHGPASALEQVLAIRIHLDDSTIENGPLRVLPRSHNRGVLTDDAIHDLSMEVCPIECLASAGDIILMKPLLVHASSKARSAAPRRVLHIEYAGTRSFSGGLELAV
jgi:ectoine hydroxylase-related dioxygenase (phytanoyl-CoA dioxygenase family)